MPRLFVTPRCVRGLAIHTIVRTIGADSPSPRARITSVALTTRQASVTPAHIGFLFAGAAALALLEGCQTYRPPAPTPGQLAHQQPRRPVRPPARPPAARNAQDTPASAEPANAETPHAGDANGTAESPAASGAAEPPPEQSAAASPPVPAAPPAPARITGLRAEEVRQRFGQPLSQRTSGAARVWRYQGTNCVVDVFFYYDTRRADFFALEQRLDGQAASPEACMATLAQPARSS